MAIPATTLGLTTTFLAAAVEFVEAFTIAWHILSRVAIRALDPRV
jgi:hypothetical protein